MKILCVLLLLLLFCINQKLKAELFNVEKIEGEGGFPSNLVYKIYQDSKGFIVEVHFQFFHPGIISPGFF